MKRFISVLIAAALSVTFTGCTGQTQQTVTSLQIVKTTADAIGASAVSLQAKGLISEKDAQAIGAATKAVDATIPPLITALNAGNASMTQQQQAAVVLNAFMQEADALSLVIMSIPGIPQEDKNAVAVADVAIDVAVPAIIANLGGLPPAPSAATAAATNMRMSWRAASTKPTK